MNPSFNDSKYMANYFVLIAFIVVCLSAAGFFLVLILMSRGLKTRSGKKAAALRDQLQRAINVFVLYEKSEHHPSSFPWNYHLQNIRKQLGSATRKQLFVDLLIANKQNLTGRSAVTLKKVYIRLGLKRFSTKKLIHASSAVKIDGLQELAEMECVASVPSVHALLHDDNKRVRQETFIALVQQGAFSLAADYSESISEWMKIAVHRHLRALPVEQLPNFSTWMFSPHQAVRKFALTMIKQFQQLEAIPTLAVLLKDKDLEVAAASAEILGDFGAAWEADSIARLGSQHMDHEALSLCVIRALSKVGGQRHESLLSFHMIHGSYVTRIEAIRALVKLKVNVLKLYIDFNIDNDKEFMALFAHASDPLLR